MTDPKPKLTVLSLGAGVQSTTLALMAAYGEIPAPDCAIFADTGAEPRAVYEHLDRLKAALPFPVHIARAARTLTEAITNPATQSDRFAVPFFSGDGMGRRQCTRHWKLDPIAREMRRLLKRRPTRGCVEVWVAISTDEAARMKPASRAWIKNRWPLIELGLSRRECHAWLAAAGWVAPKSACIYCPFSRDDQRRKMKNEAPEDWAEACRVDEAIRWLGVTEGAPQFVHRSMTPLADVDLSTWAERGQPDLFNNECEGMCGV